MVVTMALLADTRGGCWRNLAFQSEPGRPRNARRFNSTDSALFLHTGGSPAIYAYRSHFDKGASDWGGV